MQKYCRKVQPTKQGVRTLKTLKPDDRRTAHAIAERNVVTFGYRIYQCTDLDHVPILLCTEIDLRMYRNRSCTECVLLYRNGLLSKNYVRKFHVPKVYMYRYGSTPCNWGVPLRGVTVWECNLQGAYLRTPFQTHASLGST